MRLIDADALIQLLRTCADDDWNKKTPSGSWSDAYEEMILHVEDMPTVEPETNWISCKERLPEIWDYVLCSQINDDVGEGKLLDDECWHICYDQSHRKKSWVVAWQPLPEPYKKEGGEK